MKSTVYAPGPKQLHASGHTAPSFSALADKAIEDIADEKNLGLVCGPLSTGGVNNQEYNLQIFNAAIRGLQMRQERLFVQIPYEHGLRILATAWHDIPGNDGYCTPILTEFYAKIFATGKIVRAFFIPGWQSSYGSRWERQEFTQAGREVNDISVDDIRVFLEAEGHVPEHVDMLMQRMHSVATIK